MALPELRQRGGAGRDRLRGARSPIRRRPSGRPIQIFAVHYLNVTETTHADWAWKPGSPAAPRDTHGWKPVQLVPENARAGPRRPARSRVGAARNQAIWIEVYTAARPVPPASTKAPSPSPRTAAPLRVPVELQVFDFTLPDANSLDAMVYYEPSQPELYHGRNLDAAYHRFAHRNRVELVHAYDEAAVRARPGRFDGSDFTRARGYDGPGEGVGNRIVPALVLRPGRAAGTSARAPGARPTRG